MAFFSQKTGQFTYFSRQVGESHWGGKEVLDFGGNVGNILRDPNSTIEPSRYWCVDVVRDSVERGRQAYPEAHWVFYDRYCFFFNPRGEPRLPLPPLGQKFDYIVAYSVFTNTSQTDMLQQVNELEALLSDTGVLAFTFIDPNYSSWPGRYNGNNFRWRLEREIFLEGEKGNVLDVEPEQMLKRAEGADWFMLVNGDDLYLETEEIKPYEPERQRTCHVFYTADYMRRLFPHAAVLPPVNDEMQHCCVIRRT